MAVRGAAFEDRHLAIVAWSFGQLGHVPPPAARVPLLAAAEARLPAMAGRTLATLAAGLAGMERQRGWEEAQRQRRAGEEHAGSGTDAAAAAATAAEQTAEPPADSLLPPPLTAALVERAVQLLPRLRPFELAQLVHSLAVLSSQQTGQRLLCAPGPEAAAALEAAAEQAPLPTAVGLLWAMARCGCYPAQPFGALCTRLLRASPHYRLPQPALVLLGEALQAAGEEQRAALGLRRGMVFAATAAARQAAREGPCAMSHAAAADGSGGAESGGEDGQGRQRRPRDGGSPMAPSPQPSFDNANEEEGWLEMTFDSLPQVTP